MSSYDSHTFSEKQVSALVYAQDASDALGRFEDFDAATPGDPGRRIPITPQILAREAALAAERERVVVTPAMEWRRKIQLNEANLRTVPARAVKPGRVPNAPVVAPMVRKRVRRSGRLCTGCTKELSYVTRGGLCQACRKVLHPTRPGCGMCNKPMHCKALPGAGVSFCHACRRIRRQSAAADAVLAAGGVRMCSAGCGREMKPTTKGDRCWMCATGRKDESEPLVRFACDKGCGRLRRGGRGPGLCVKCKAKSRKVKLTAEQRRKYQHTRNLREDRHCGDCNVLIKYSSSTGFCRVHAPAHRAEAKRLEQR